jgi:HK97 family phage prohead protease
VTEDRGPVELRSAAIADVSYPDRTISLVAVPYNETAIVEYPPNSGKLVEESVDPGAFGAVHNRARRFLVNLEHDEARIVGNVRDLRSTDAGLMANVKIRRTAEGDQALDDAADGMLGASIGMAVSPAGQVWETRTRRRIAKAFLDHIALTFTPAYLGAEILEVRAEPTVHLLEQTSATPNLDRILAERRGALYIPR